MSEKKDDERLRNMIVFHVPETDEEITQMNPIITIVLVVLVIGGLIAWFILK
jgi:hypothetical protein